MKKLSLRSRSHGIRRRQSHGHTRGAGRKWEKPERIIPGGSVPKDLVNIDVSGTKYVVELMALRTSMSI